MLRGLIKHRPRYLLAVYVESHQVEIQRAHRHWRTWQIDSTERIPVPEGENLHDFLQRLNLRPRGKLGTALILFLPRTYYTFHREHYPASLGEQLEEALNFDWQENIFNEPEKSLHFFGPPVPVDEFLTVPIFTLQTEIYDKFYQSLGAVGFQTFSVIPSALASKAFLSSLPVELADDEEPSPLKVIGRIIDPLHLEVNRFYNGLLLDSVLVSRASHSIRQFQESLVSTDGSPDGKIPIHLICTRGESSDTPEFLQKWLAEGLPFRVHSTEDTVIAHWVRHLLGQEEIQTFEAPLILKPWEVPRVAYGLVAVILIYSAFAFYQVYASDSLQETSRNLRRESAKLETQWKPIEELQTRIAKFQEDQKTLTEFNVEGYPMMEILTLLTHITPDDTWLNYLSLRKGQLILRGESKSAVRYISELSRVEGLSDVRFASPVTRNPTSDMERFNVQLQMDVERLRNTITTMQIPVPPDEIDPEVTEMLSPPPSPQPAQAVELPESATPPAVEEEELEEEEEEPEDEETEAAQ
jgi:Tfp pilus assembly protein PilN